MADTDPLRNPAESLLPPKVPGSSWTWHVPDVGLESLPLLFHRVQGQLAVGDVLDCTFPPARGLATDRAEWLTRIAVGAGFAVDGGVVSRRGGAVRARLVRERTLADTIGPKMRLLVCGVNPSPYSANAGVGYARPGNRFWPAALEAGLVVADRDPVAALAGGMGMTDFVKRATPTAAEVTSIEFRVGLERVEELVGWLAPGAVCFVGLSGWRTAVDRHAAAGIQPTMLHSRPVYVMPSTSGRNARVPVADLAGHLCAAWELGAR